MIEVQHDGGTGRIGVRSSHPADVVGPDPDRYVWLSAEAVGEIVRLASTSPGTVPQQDARRILEGRR